MSVRRDTKAARLQKSFTTSELVALRFEFNRFDVDNSNTIDAEELRQVVKNLSDGVELTDPQIAELMAEVDDDESGEIDWEEYLELIINLRTGRGLRSGAVSALLSRPPLILIVEAELGHRKFMSRLLKEANLAKFGIPQKKIDIVDYKSADEALEFMRTLPPSRKCCLCICDTHGILADKFCADLETECLVPPPVAYFATEKHKGDPLPHLVQQYILKDSFDERTVERLVEQFCVEPDIPDHDDDPTTASGHLRKKGMIGGRGRHHGHSNSTKGSGTHRKKNTLTVKSRLIRAPKSFAKSRWKGALSALSPRALAQLAVVGGAAEGTSKIFLANPKAKEAEEAEERRLLEEELAQRKHEEELLKQIKIAKEIEMNRLPVWKVLVSEGLVRTCSGLHYVDASAIEGEIPSPRRPETSRFSPNLPRTPRTPRTPRPSEQDSPRHNNLMSLHASPSAAK